MDLEDVVDCYGTAGGAGDIKIPMARNTTVFIGKRFV
jgi:hypothetical protein